MKIEPATESRALIDAHGRELARLREALAELEKTCRGLRDELRRAGMPTVTEAWD